MQIPKPCITCGELTPVGNRCPRHQAQYDANRNRSPERAKYKEPAYIEYVKDGQCFICGSTEKLQKHHLGETVSDGIKTLCDPCHRAITNRQWGSINRKWEEQNAT